MICKIDCLGREFWRFAITPFGAEPGTRGGRDQSRQSTFEQLRHIHADSPLSVCKAWAIRCNRMTTVISGPMRISATAIARNRPRASKSDSNSDARLATTNTHSRAGLAIGPTKKLPAPLAAPRVRTYAVRIAAAAADQPKATPQSVVPTAQIPAVAYPAAASN